MAAETLPPIDWERIIGFGNPTAPVVFIGMEEGLADADALMEDLEIRSTYETPIMDLKDAFRDVRDADRYCDLERRSSPPGGLWPTSCYGARACSN
jgi:hypothetical protein